MKTINADIAIIGGGPAGLAAAIQANKSGISHDRILIIERNEFLGGILQQCIHDGFGILLFNKLLTGPEYAQIFVDDVRKREIKYMLGSTVTSIKKVNGGFSLEVCSKKFGIMNIMSKSIIFSTGCRERTRGQILIPGTRPAGIYTAGCVQNLVNLKGILPGKNIVILGSGDIGLIMARRLTLEGVNVKAVVEIMPYSSGLPRNIVQCLQDYNIPLYLKHTVVEIRGKKKLEEVVISRVDDNFRPIEGTERILPCDTLVLSVGLIPENELLRGLNIAIDPCTNGPIVDENLQTSIKGIFSCGNCLHVHDLVDYVTLEGKLAGKNAAEYVLGKMKEKKKIKVRKGSGLRYVLPHFISGKKDISLSTRVLEPGREKKIIVKSKNRILKEIFKRKVNPAEMIRFELRKENLEDVSGEIVVSLENSSL